MPFDLFLLSTGLILSSSERHHFTLILQEVSLSFYENATICFTALRVCSTPTLSNSCQIHQPPDESFYAWIFELIAKARTKVQVS